MWRCRATWIARRFNVPRPLASRLQYRQFSGNELIDRQNHHVLAIETSCDDTSVALLSNCKADGEFISKVLFHKRVTADSSSHGGIHPIVALESHQRNLSHLVTEAVNCLEHEDVGPEAFYRRRRVKPDLIAVTRGPGMRSNLSVGLNVAKGLALAWEIPLIGVHHMQAHALTPRLLSIFKDGDEPPKRFAPDSGQAGLWVEGEVEPKFPFLTILASGGHTMLVSSNSLVDHKILAETSDIAIGDFLDKAARSILPLADLSTPYGKALEDFAFGVTVNDAKHASYHPPRTRQAELERRATKWGWSLAPPLAESMGGEKSSRRMMYSFAGLLSTIARLTQDSSRSIEERRDLARESLRVSFEHLTSRIFIHLQSLTAEEKEKVDTIVVSGGVAANSFLRHVLRSTLDARGYERIGLEFPPAELCTDNALMIAWAGLEMHDAGYESSLEIEALRKWSLDPGAEDGGIRGAIGWKTLPPERTHDSDTLMSENSPRPGWVKWVVAGGLAAGGLSWMT